MRSVLTRVATVTAGVALATLAIPAGTAAAATSTSCPAAGSTRLFTGGVLGSPDNRLWVYSPSTTQTIVCFDIPFGSIGGGAIVVNGATGFTPPTVTVGSNPATCTAEIVDIVDPVPFRLATGASGTTVCFTVNSSTTTLTFGLPSVTTLPSVQIWRDGTFGWFDVAACASHLVAYAGGNTTPYFTCVNTPARIV